MYLGQSPIWSVYRKSDDDAFEASFCKIAGIPCGIIRDLVNLDWHFVGLKLTAAGEPAPYNSSFDKDMWTLSVIIYEYFSYLSTEELVSDAAYILAEFSNSDYSRELCKNSASAQMFLRVLSDLELHCNVEELETIDQFKSTK